MQKQTKWKSDEQIKNEFDDFKITYINRETKQMEIEFPKAEESVGGGTNYVVENYIIYEDGRIAFDNWYPENIYNKLCKKIKEVDNGIQSNVC